MTPGEWVGLIAGLTGIAGAFVAALRWTVHQFVRELATQMFHRMDKIETEIGVLTARQSEIYATLMAKGGFDAKANKVTKGRAKKKQGARR